MNIGHISTWIFDPSRMQGIQMEMRQLEMFSWEGWLPAPQLLWEVGQGWDESLSTWDDASMGNSNSLPRDKSLNPASPGLFPPLFPTGMCFVSSNKLKSMDGVRCRIVILESGVAGILLNNLGIFLEEKIPINWKKKFFGMRRTGLKTGRHEQSWQIPVFPGHLWCFRLDFLLRSLRREEHLEGFSFTKGTVSGLVSREAVTKHPQAFPRIPVPRVAASRNFAHGLRGGQELLGSAHAWSPCHSCGLQPHQLQPSGCPSARITLGSSRIQPSTEME